MRTLRKLVGVVVAAGIALVAMPRGSEAETDVPSCVTVTSQAIYRGVGYDHVVRVANGCEVPVDCLVWTDVNPEKAALRVAAHDVAEVITWHGSPWYAFTASARCTKAR